uniref:RNA polymerase b''-subunit n=1 Tax=Meringosphaera mediterranea TaxID=2837474 RepID=UPI00286CF32E|nr:RNA polymerase b''-subunit [Meringosphaera mediterranea]WLD05756.1 RNA polymerase b''-subunit [Meringosphaera mediterranea]WLD05834.1 RNA polymerase b''-subunit [Meringosphaera mediterranea]
MNKNIEFKNQIFSKKELKQVIYQAFTDYGFKSASRLADDMKDLGFHYATCAGISLSVEDLKVPPTKHNLLKKAQTELINSDSSYDRGEITTVERFQRIIDTWNTTSESLKNDLVSYFYETDPSNPIYLMAFSGARGNLSQVRQLVGMRGLMSDPNGQIIDIPIVHNFREGLTLTDYIMSSYGARKGVVDTALRTADSGYLTRRLIDVAQDVIIREYDCFTTKSIKLFKDKNTNNFNQKAIGRTVAEAILNPEGKEIISAGEQITKEQLKELNKGQTKFLKIRSPLTCKSTRSICQKCYGWNLAYGKLVELGEAVGIIAAQSIGEPGTQLTMRTFHTGGIFTADPSRQICATASGLLSIDKSTPTRPSRTIYGTDVHIVERDTQVTIQNYLNKKVELKLPIGSSLVAKKSTFVKKGELIAELPLKNQKTALSRKDIIAPFSGEIFLTDKTKELWVLKGDVHDLPENSLNNNFNFLNNISINDSLTRFKIKNKKAGILYLNKQSNENTLSIINCLNILNYEINKEHGTSNFLLKCPNNQYYKLNKLKDGLKTKPKVFAKRLTNKYQTKVGGDIYLGTNDFFEMDNKTGKKIIKKNGKLLFIPEETHYLNKNKNHVYVYGQKLIAEPRTQIMKGVLSKTAGFLESLNSQQIIDELTIKPGKWIDLSNATKNELNELNNLNNTILFPGETILQDEKIEYLSLIYLNLEDKVPYVLIRPIQEFNIPKPNLETVNKKLNQNLFKNNLKLTAFNSIKNLGSQELSSNNCLTLVENEIGLENTSKEKTRIESIEFKLIPKGDKEKKYYIGLTTTEILNTKELIDQNIQNERIKLTFQAQNFNFVEANTILGWVSILPKKNTKLKQLSWKPKPEKKLLLVGEEDYKTYYFENKVKNVVDKEVIKIKDPLNKSLVSLISGKIVSNSAFNLTLHKGRPFYLTKGTSLYKKVGDFIKKDEPLGVIKFEQIITGDIVQGLPKVEEILEARKPHNTAFLSPMPGVISNIYEVKGNLTNEIKITIRANNLLTKNGKFEYIGKEKRHPGKRDILVSKYDFVSVGQPLTSGNVNPHTLLKTYYNYFKEIKSETDAAWYSFKSVQALLIQKVQQVYNSQGVDIDNKHLEIITSRITAKVKVVDGGGTEFLPDEIVDLKQLDYINFILSKTKHTPISYEPILLGITRAALLTESFVSAASFQETTKTLTRAAIEGKVDWLRGLKENVIIGRLIPAGTGFINNYEDKKLLETVKN